MCTCANTGQTSGLPTKTNQSRYNLTNKYVLFMFSYLRSLFNSSLWRSREGLSKVSGLLTYFLQTRKPLTSMTSPFPISWWRFITTVLLSTALGWNLKRLHEVWHERVLLSLSKTLIQINFKAGVSNEPGKVPHGQANVFYDNRELWVSSEQKWIEFKVYSTCIT